MNHAVTFYLPWLLSVITITSTIMAGNLHRWSWALSGLNQILWFTWIVNDWEKNQGLLAMNLVLAAVFIRNHMKWKRLMLDRQRVMQRYGSPR